MASRRPLAIWCGGLLCVAIAATLVSSCGCMKRADYAASNCGCGDCRCADFGGASDDYIYQPGDSYGATGWQRKVITTKYTVPTGDGRYRYILRAEDGYWVETTSEYFRQVRSGHALQTDRWQRPLFQQGGGDIGPLKPMSPYQRVGSDPPVGETQSAERLTDQPQAEVKNGGVNHSQNYSRRRGRR